MNLGRKTIYIAVTVLLVATLTQLTVATSSTSSCKRLKGSSIQTFDPDTGVISGAVGNAGILNGSLEDAIDFAGGFLPTPDATVFTYRTNLTITTIDGQLKLHPVTTQSVVTGAGTEFGDIDGAASTGRFAGASGVVYVIFKLIGDPVTGPWEAEISADVCLAH